MHEVSLVEDLLTIAEEELNRARVGEQVRSVVVRVGALSGVNAEALRFAFEAVSPKTKLSGARLVIRRVPATGRCRRCGYTGPIEDPLSACPQCGHPFLRIEGGRDLQLESLEIDESQQGQAQ